MTNLASCLPPASVRMKALPSVIQAPLTLLPAAPVAAQSLGSLPGSCTQIFTVLTRAMVASQLTLTAARFPRKAPHCSRTAGSDWSFTPTAIKAEPVAALAGFAGAVGVEEPV